MIYFYVSIIGPQINIFTPSLNVCRYSKCAGFCGLKSCQTEPTYKNCMAENNSLFYIPSTPSPNLMIFIRLICWNGKLWYLVKNHHQPLSLVFREHSEVELEGKKLRMKYWFLPLDQVYILSFQYRFPILNHALYLKLCKYFVLFRFGGFLRQTLRYTPSLSWLLWWEGRDREKKEEISSQETYHSHCIIYYIHDWRGRR